MHTLIRSIFTLVLIVLLVVGIVLISCSKLQKKRLCMIFVAVLLFIIYCLFLVLPLEEPFLTFPTIEEAFRYKSDDEISLVLDGKDSSMVVAWDEAADGYLGTILPKVEGGWKPAVNLDKRIAFSTFSGKSMVMLFRYRNTQDFYIAIASPPSGLDGLSDNRNSEFESITGSSQEKDLAPGYYYAFLDGVDSTYVLTIDGEKITFPDLK